MNRPLPLHLLHPALAERARTLVDAGVLAPAELLLVDAVADRFSEAQPDALLGLALALRAPRAGHTGVHLPELPGTVGGESSDPRSEQVPIDWPVDLQSWQQQTLGSPLVGGPAEGDRPFVGQTLPDGRTLLLTRRMWREQERLAHALQALASEAPDLCLTNDAVADGVQRLFGGADKQGARAVAAAADRRLVVVTGGPGTGKTYSIKRLLTLLIEASLQAQVPLRVALAAPTGKAAVRMAQAIAEDLDALPASDEVRERLRALEPRTLHKLLGVRPDGTTRHGAEAPVPADVIVVDEASMVDLALMRRLCEAVPAGARLVLLGDRDQLASVEAGTVLADVVGPVLDGLAPAERALSGAVVHFDTNHRFAQAPTVAAIAAGLQRRDDAQVDTVVDWMLGTARVPDEPLPDRVTHLGIPADGRPDEARHLERLAAPYLSEPGYIGQLAEALRQHGDSVALQQGALHEQLLAALESYRVLAVHRRGPLGVSGLHRWLAARCRRALEQALRQRRGLADDAPVRLPSRSGHWLGEPVLITENSYEVGLMNGDIGLVLPTANGLAAVFPAASSHASAPRQVALARLPAHTGAFCMTVHKSQGSQFQRVALVLAGRDSPIQTRELVYTAITRTQSHLDWLGEPEELRRALKRRVQRASGLGALLWG